MSRNPIRQDKTCLNCSHVVDQRYCPNCGQENTETRKTFHHLFIHFFEDLTHYENAFWKTIGNLLFRPGSLTKVYLSGKRMSYLAPIRLYIFISFVTFFLLSVLPESESSGSNNVNLVGKQKSGVKYSWEKDAKTSAEIQSAIRDSLKLHQTDTITETEVMGFTEKELDSLQHSSIADDKSPDWFYHWLKKAFHIQKNNTRAELREKFAEAVWHNVPKALFIYMPMFAFILWIFQNKRRWYYFDHGIFTLHYFSFLLLIYLIAGLISCILSLLGDNTAITVINVIIRFALYCYAFYYFFPAHHRFYGETRIMTIVKGGFICVINFFLASILMTALIIYSFLNIH
jgi:hypothetical protein